MRRIYKQSDVTLKLTGDETQSVVIENCENLTVNNAKVTQWYSSGDITKGGDYAIVLKNCHNVTLVNPIVEGAPDESSKDAWRNSVGNGIRINDDCTSIKITGHNLTRLHFPIDNRGESIIENGLCEFISADHIISRSSNTIIRNNQLLNSLEVLPYELIHRDYVQLFAPSNGTLYNVSVTNNTLKTDVNSHKWTKDPQGITLTDGTGDAIKVIGNKITTNSDIAILLNPCINSVVADNEIISDGNPIVACEDRKNTGCVIDTEFRNNTGESFDRWCDNLRNLKAPAVTELDYEEAGLILGISPAMVAAVSNVESRGKGFNRDGSLRILLERHKVYKYAKEAGCLPEMIKQVGSANCNELIGGYQGSIAEVERLKKVGAVNKEVALKSISSGTHQIMGFNSGLAGYESAEDMFVSFHESEKNQLDGFVQFIINNDLSKYLKEAETLADNNKSPLKPLNEFANRYNGKAHKKYDLAIANAYQDEKRKRNGYETRSIAESTTNQGGLTATIGTIGAGALTAKELLEEFRATKDTVTEVTIDLKDEVDSLKEKVSEPSYFLWLIIGFLILAQFGIFTSIWARIQDRLKGLHL